MALPRRIANLFRRSQVDSEIAAELESHLAMRIEDNLAAGMTPEEARRNARVRFGNQAATKERVVAEDASLPLSSLWRNLRFALRQLRRSPGFALTAILTLALGIGPNVAIFSIIWATFLAPVPYPHPEQVVVVWNHWKGERSPTSGEEYAQFATENQSFQSLAFQSWVLVHLTNPDHTADQIAGFPISPGMDTRTIGRPMALGRDFQPDEGGPGKDHLAILSHWLWQNRYNSDPNIIGKSILIQDGPYTVVGVTKPGPHDHPGGVQFNVPVRLIPGVRTNHFGIMIGRLKPGVTLAQAQAELSVIDRRFMRQSFGGSNANPSSLTVETFRNDWLDPKIRRNLWLLLASVGLVLLIACANIANLLLARGTSRNQELAVRSALGATRRQIFAQLLTESLVLAFLGGAAGIAMGWAIMRLSMASFPNLVNTSSDAVVEMNIPVLCFAILIAVLSGVVFGCAPGWKATRLNLIETLKQGSRSSGRSRATAQSVLVIAEISLALILLSGAGLALHSFWNLSQIDVGFNTDNLLTALLRPAETPGHGGMPTFPPPQQILVQQHQLIDRIRSIPGVADAAIAMSLPLHGYNNFPFTIAGQPVDKDHLPMADFDAVTPSFFNALGVRLVRGRLLSESDTLGAPPVVVVNETFVRRYLNNRDPLTQHLMMPGAFVPGNKQPPPLTQYQIVGVFHDVLDDSHLTGTVQPEMYVSQWQAATPWVWIAVHTVVDPSTVTRDLQAAVAAVEPTSAIDHVEVEREIVDEQSSGDRFEMVLLAGFAALALLLAAVGVFGVMAFSVAQRTREIGIRMALGAHRHEVVVLVASGGIRLAFFGVVIGLAGAYGLGRVMQATLYGVGAIDIVSLTAVSALILVVAAVACWLPASRSAAVDPMQALRNE